MNTLITSRIRNPKSEGRSSSELAGARTFVSASDDSALQADRNVRAPMRDTTNPVARTFRISPFGFLSGFGFRVSGFILVCLFLMSAPLTLRAEISEPDNVLYGSITISNQPVTAARTDVVIETRRTPEGPAIASYRMGSDPALGNFYSLTLKLESVGSPDDTNASTAGENVFIVLKDSSGVVGQTGFTIPERGHVQRIDFGAPLEDVDGNGLPDLWELAHLGSAGNDPDGVALNRLSLMQNFIAGTDPNNPDDLFKLAIDRIANQATVSFLARKAQGPGYDGRTRFYSIESRQGIGGDWSAVPGYTDVTGDNQTVTYVPSTSTAMATYRGRVNLMLLQTPGAPTLSIGRSGPDILISWPASVGNFTLQENDGLSPSGWVDVLQPVSDGGTQRSLRISTPSATRLYRLRQ